MITTPPAVQQQTLHMTKSRRPALWESGGAGSNTGAATIIAGPKGEKKRPYFVPTSGHLSCQDHALVPVEIGSWVILVSYWNKARNSDGFDIEVYRITAIDLDEEVATRELMGKWDGRQWSDRLPADWPAEAIRAGREKAMEYHCRQPRYTLPR